MNREIGHNQRQQNREHVRPVTPEPLNPMNQSPNSPQVSPRTRRHAQVREQHPLDSPPRRRIAQRHRGANLHHPRQLVARTMPLDPHLDVRHSFEGAFDNEYLLHHFISLTILDVHVVVQDTGLKKEFLILQNRLQNIPVVMMVQLNFLK